MRPILTPTRVLPAVVLAACGCASAPAPPDAPAKLHPPAGEVLFLEARGSGVQIYECVLKTDQPPEWKFRAPEAALVDDSGHSLGKHYAGPTWESNDGSSVVGEVKARDAGPDKNAIPWLLLAAKSTAGSGAFSATTSIQRLQTAGGVAPSEACGTAHAGQVVRIPYTAMYYFYRAPR